MIAASGESAPRNAVRKSPAALIAMPAEATMRGSTLSESRPARGENSAIITGWASMTSPAVRGTSPLMYWR